MSNIQNAIAGLTVPASGTGSLAITGTPTATGTETFTVTATDSAGRHGERQLQHHGEPGGDAGPGDAAGGHGEHRLQPDDHGRRRHGHGDAGGKQHPERHPRPDGAGQRERQPGDHGHAHGHGDGDLHRHRHRLLGATANANYSITVNPAVSLGPATLPADTVNVAYYQTITASGRHGRGSLRRHDGEPADRFDPECGHRRDQRHAECDGIVLFYRDGYGRGGAVATKSYTVTINPAVLVDTATFSGATQVFSTAATHVFYADNFVPVSSGGAYQLSGTARSGNGSGGQSVPADPQYFGYACYDVDHNQITALDTAKVSGSTDTVLAQRVNPGDSKIYLVNASGWYAGSVSSRAEPGVVRLHKQGGLHVSRLHVHAERAL